MVNFVIEIAAHDDPPEAHLAPESRVEDLFGKLLFRQAFEQGASPLAGASQGIEQRQIGSAVGYLDGAGVPDGGRERLHFCFFEERLVCIDGVLGQCSRPGGTRRNRFNVESRTAWAKAASR